MPINSRPNPNRNPLPRWHVRLLAAGAMIFLGASGCYHAPTITGDDQVPNVNVEATAAKDNEFQTAVWPLVDTAMGSLVPDPDSEPGCALGVVRDHQIIYLKGYGYPRLPDPLHADAGEKWGVNTMGAVGSVAKSFTAVAALQMWEQGLIDINGQVKDYLNTSNTALGNIRLYDLLSHTSGAGGTTKAAAFQPNFEPDSLVQACIDDDPDFSTAGCQAIIRELARPAYAFNSYDGNETAPDLGMITDNLKHGVYSNVGYSIMGAIIDRVARDSTSSDGGRFRSKTLLTGLRR